MRDGFFSGFSPARRVFVAAALAFGLAATAAPAVAASPAEQFVSDSVAKGLNILNDRALSTEQRKDRFQNYLFALCDLRAIAEYTLGTYRRMASPADLAAYDAAYRDYAVAVYQSYFDKFTGQTLKVISSMSPGSGDFVVKTQLIDPAKPNAKPMLVSFRLAQNGGKFTVVDMSAEGVWLRQTQRDDFTGFLGNHGGDIKALIQVLKAKTADIKAGKKKK